jgi:hypothetical protein
MAQLAWWRYFPQSMMLARDVRFFIEHGACMRELQRIVQEELTCCIESQSCHFLTVTVVYNSWKCIPGHVPMLEFGATLIQKRCFGNLVWSCRGGLRFLRCV